MIIVAPRTDGEPRIVVLWGKTSRKPAWFPAVGAPGGSAGFWYVHSRRKKVPVGVDGAKPPRLIGEAIVVSADTQVVVYWTGKKLVAHPIEVPSVLEARELTDWPAVNPFS